MEVNPDKFPKVNAKGGKAFADFLLSSEVQNILKTFGVDKFGEPLFIPMREKRRMWSDSGIINKSGCHSSLRRVFAYRLGGERNGFWL